MSTSSLAFSSAEAVQSFCTGFPILDLRSKSLYQQSHIKNSAHFPLAELANRLHELPWRGQSLNLLGASSQLQKATEFLSAKGYLINHQQVASKESLKQFQQASYLASGKHYQRLWQPAQVVKRFIDDYSAKCEAKHGVDLACGAGRDSIYMAMHGWQMTAADYSPSALKKLSDLAFRTQQVVTTELLDLEKTDLDELFVKLSLVAPIFQCIVMVRYLHRPHLAKLKQLLEVGGFFLYQTFLQGCEKMGGPKNPRFLLKKGELAEIFNDCDILLDEIVYLADGRPTNCFIARKK